MVFAFETNKGTLFFKNLAKLTFEVYIIHDCVISLIFGNIFSIPTLRSGFDFLDISINILLIFIFFFTFTFILTRIPIINKYLFLTKS